MRARWNIVGFALTGCMSPPDLPYLDEVPLAGQGACAPSRVERVACVVQGDVVDLGACGTGGERVRLLGVEAPEPGEPGVSEECWATESLQALKQKAEGEHVMLSFDADCEDIEGNTLAYLYLWDDEGEPDLNEDDEEQLGELLNERMLYRGHARLGDPSDFDDLRLWEELEAAENSARARRVGLWSACDEG